MYRLDEQGLAKPSCFLQEGYTLFSIPRELTLSTRTSQLPAKLGESAWKQFKLHVGWAGLILCMMWEEAQGVESKWHGYMCQYPLLLVHPLKCLNDQSDHVQPYCHPNLTLPCSGVNSSWKN